MNCKPGDLAVVVGRRFTFPQNLGRLCKVLRLAVASDADYVEVGQDWYIEPAGVMWGCDRGRLGWTSVCGVIADVDLRPIRPNTEAEQLTNQLEVTA